MDEITIYIGIVFGTVGMILCLVAFALNLLQKMSQNSELYSLLNLFGSASLVFYSYTLQSTIFAVLEFIWSLFAFYFLIRCYRR